MLPVGQGDCVAMYCPNGNLVMFDCGSSMREKGLTEEEVKGLLTNKNVQKVTICISHGDVDHYKYLPTVFNDLTKIDGVIIGGHPKDYDGSETIKKWMLALAQNNKLYAINKFKNAFKVAVISCILLSIFQTNKVVIGYQTIL